MAYSSAECACDADWTPQEVIDLRKEIGRLKAELARFHAAYDKAKALYDWHRQYKDGHINNRLQYRGAKDVFSCFLFCEPPTTINPSDSAPAGDVGDTNVVEMGGGHAE